ncbi:MAG: hypothetical protein QOE70_2665 [Chthoniobacter sp.]|jgi:hypothetical protein|nr:hypothetical protein [Chthoniobacter sp.]
MDAPEPKKPFMKRLQERLAASRFLTFSLLLHVIIVVMGGSVVLFKIAQEQPDFEASDGGLVSSEVTAAPPPEQPVDLTQQTFTPDAPQITAPTLSAISTTNITTPTFAVASAVPVVKPVQTDAMSKALEKAATAMTKGVGGGAVPGAMSGRMGGAARSKAMMATGGKQKSEEAVMRGLRWLVKVQNEDGSWGKQNISAMTGFAVLCFLGHGETNTSAEFGPVVQKGADWIIKQGTDFQGHLNRAKSFGGGPPVYEHAIASYALGEYYSMTKDERAGPILRQAIKYIIDGQGPDGGWMYSYDKSQSDTSVSGWQIQALKAAHLSDLKIEGVDACLDKAMLNLKRVQGDKGGFGYREPGSERYSLTGVGVLCTYFWKQDKDELVRDGIKYMLDKDKPEVDYKADTADLYAWYYNTQACLMVGGSAWSKWNRMFQDQICDNQSPEGSWPPIHGKHVIGGLDRPDGDGPVYRTALCILMLEVYYRYMPVTKGM